MAVSSPSAASGGLPLILPDKESRGNGTSPSRVPKAPHFLYISQRLCPADSFYEISLAFPVVIGYNAFRALM
jgi:hypothetical protein